MVLNLSSWFYHLSLVREMSKRDTKGLRLILGITDILKQTLNELLLTLLICHLLIALCIH